MKDKKCPFCADPIPSAQSPYAICLNVFCEKYGKPQDWNNLIDPVVKLHKPKPTHLIRKSKYKPTKH